METKIQTSLNYFLVLLDATFGLSHASFINELSDENTLQIIEELLECFKSLLKAIRKGAVLNENIESSISELY